MTKKSKKNKPPKPALYIFKHHDVPTELAGLMFKHTTGPGYVLTIGDDRYTVVPPPAEHTSSTAPDFYVFMQFQSRMVMVGAMFKQETGKGYKLFVKGTPYKALPRFPQHQQTASTPVQKDQ